MSEKKQIKELILHELSYGPMSTKLLIFRVRKISNSTIQGVYKTIRHLRKKEVIVLHNKNISISSIWLEHEAEKIKRTQNTYLIKNKFFDKDNVSDQSISFVYKTINELDLFWVHSFLSLEEECDRNAVSIAIAPHDWFSYARKETDDVWMKKHNIKNIESWVIITHPSEVDKKIIKQRRAISGKNFKWLFDNPLKQKENIYYNIIGDYIFKVTLDGKIAHELNSFIKENKTIPISSNKETELKKIVSKKGKFKIQIIKSKDKSSKIKNKIKKYFI